MIIQHVLGVQQYKGFSQRKAVFAVYAIEQVAVVQCLARPVTVFHWRYFERVEIEVRRDPHERFPAG